MKRNPGIELYRCFLMFGIVFIHCAYNSVGGMSIENYLGRWCVDGFVFISGYFGATLSLKRVLKLYGLVIVCDIVSRLASALVMGNIGVSNVFAINAIIAGIRRPWFVHAYVLALCLAPLINATLERKDGFKIVGVFIASVLLWGLATELPYLGKILPTTKGIGSYTGLTLAAAYAVGRIVRLKDFDSFFRTCHLLLALPVLLAVDVFSVPHGGIWNGGWLGSYASPFAVATAFVVFALFTRVKLPNGLARVVLFLSPSMFPVYLMHWTDCGYYLMHDMTLKLMQAYPTFLACLVMAFVVWTSTLVLDMPRRFVVMGIRKIRQ